MLVVTLDSGIVISKTFECISVNCEGLMGLLVVSSQEDTFKSEIVVCELLNNCLNLVKGLVGV